MKYPEIQDAEIFDQRHCENGGGFIEQDSLLNRVIVMDVMGLSPPSRKPEYQLAAVEFMDHETLECRVLFDGLSECIHISEAIGILKDEYWPQWLLDKAGDTQILFLSNAEAGVMMVPENNDPGRPPLSKRLAEYRESKDFYIDASCAQNERFMDGLPPLGLLQLRAEVLATKKEMLQNEIQCELEGHQIEETADSENGASHLSCDRCGYSQTFYW